MIDPAKGVLDKGAVTRMDNTKKQAKRQTMPMNEAAKLSLRHKTAATKKPTSPVGQPDFDPASSFAPAPTPVPTGGPALPPEQLEGFDPEVFKQDMLDNIVGSVRTEQFLNSPQVKDATTSVLLKEAFNQSNTNRKPDPRMLMDRVLSRIRN